MPKGNQILLDRNSGTAFLLRQITNQHQKSYHAWNHISDHSNMAKIANKTLSRQNKGII